MEQKFSLSEHNIVVIPVMINDKGPYEMVLDIGAKRTVIHPDYVEELGLQVKEEEMEGATAHGAFTHSKSSVVNKFCIV